jgi:hypothetical protein
MKNIEGLNEVSITGHYSKWPHLNFEIIINETNKSIWEFYVKYALLTTTDETYIKDNGYGLWPVRNFQRYTYFDSKDNYLNVQEIYTLFGDRLAKFKPHANSKVYAYSNLNAFDEWFNCIYDFESQYDYDQRNERLFLNWELIENS